MKSHNDAYSVNVLVNGKPVTEVKHQGDTFIEGRSNSVFELHFKNHSPRNVLVIPSVDGLNTIDGESCGIESQGYVVRAFQELTIPGWTIDQKQVAKFQFKKQGGSGKNQTYTEAVDESTGNQGLIGFMVFKEKYVSYGGGVTIRGGHNPWESSPYTHNYDTMWSSSTTYDTMSIMGSSSAPVDIETKCSGMSSDQAAYSANIVEEPSLGTGFGKASSFDTTTTSFERESSPDVVFVYHYDTLKNLERKGVPVAMFHEHHAKPRPSPFPKSPEVKTGCKIPYGWKG